MMTSKTKAYEASVKGQNYLELEKALSKVGVQTLIELLDSTSIKIGDTATTWLMRQNAYPELINAVLGGVITTKLGKIRTVNALFSAGRKYPKAKDAYLRLLADKSDEIASCALFSLVFWGDKSIISTIKERQKLLVSSERIQNFCRACDAIEKSDTSIFALNFSDTTNAWK